MGSLRIASLSRHFTTTSAIMAPITKEADIVVLGGGSGGLASARAASGKYGAKAIVIEGKRLGGTCVNVGCVPKKVTYNAAALSEAIHDSKAYGFNVEQVAPFDWPTFKKKRDAYITRLNGIYERNLNNDKVEYPRPRPPAVQERGRGYTGRWFQGRHQHQEDPCRRWRPTGPLPQHSWSRLRRGQ